MAARGESPSEGRVRLRNAAFGYGGKAVVSNVELEFGAGDFVGVVGPNGAGKTTLFRGILGLLPPLSGAVERSGVRPGYVPQRDALDPVFPLTVEEVVLMGAAGRLDALGRTRARDRAFAASLLERVGLTRHARALFRALSGGERQRALLARALLKRPNVLLLDEPTSGVDRPTQDLVLALLDELNRVEGLAILLVSHQLAATRRVVRRVVWVDGGRALPVDARALEPERIDALFAGAAGMKVGGEED